MRFSTMDALNAYIKSKIGEALKDEVTKAVQEQEMASVDSVVYAAYGNRDTGEPNRYVRGHGERGIGAPGEIVGILSGQTTLTVKNTAAEADIVVSGGPYEHSPGKNTFGDFRVPRDFIADAAAKLSAGSAASALASGLNARGIPTR